jgi:hypothetical protein
MHTRTNARIEFVKDPLLSEIRGYRDDYGAAHKYDVHAMGRDLRKREKQSGRKLATLKLHRSVECK